MSYEVLARPLHRAMRRASERVSAHVETETKAYVRGGGFDLFKVVRTLPWDDWSETVRDAWEVHAGTMLVQARDIEGRAQKERASTSTADFPTTSAEEMALEYLETNGVSLVRRLSADNRRAMVAVLDKAIREGWSVPKIVRDVRDMVGLLPRDVQAVQNRERALVDDGKSARVVERDLSRYRKALVKRRAENIARTETVRALNHGRLQSWRLMAQEGKLPSTMKRKWVAAPGERTCQICVELAMGDPVALMSPFSSSVVGRLLAPPAHPSCRCTVVLV